MKLPSGQEIKDETLSEIADFMAMDMLGNEVGYVDAFEPMCEELERGFEGEHETLPGIDEEDRRSLYELLRVPTLEYLEALRRTRDEAFNRMPKGKEW